MKPAITIVTILVVIVGIIVGLIAWSYTQIQVNLDNASFAGIDWAQASFATLVKLGLNVLSGNWIGAAFSLIQGVKFNFMFGLSNHGIFPVYIPDLSYNLSINGVNIGQGQNSVDVTINPGDTKEISILQNVQTSSLEPVVTSIISTNGIMNLQVSGTAYFKLLGLTIPVPFQSTKQISIKDEIQNHVNSILAQNPQNSGSSNTLGSIANQSTGAVQGIIGAISNAIQQPAKEKTYLLNSWDNDQLNLNIKSGSQFCIHMGVYTMNSQNQYVGVPYASVYFTSMTLNSQNQWILQNISNTAVIMNDQGVNSACFPTSNNVKITLAIRDTYYGDSTHESGVGNWAYLTINP